MLLAIDAGNTNVVFALLEGQDVRARWRIATDPRRTADEYAVWLNQLLQLEGYTIGDVTSVIIATVVPRALHNLQVLAEKYFKVTALIAGHAPVEWGSNSMCPNRPPLARTGLSTLSQHTIFKMAIWS